MSYYSHAVVACRTAPCKVIVVRGRYSSFCIHCSLQHTQGKRATTPNEKGFNWLVLAGFENKKTFK